MRTLLAGAKALAIPEGNVVKITSKASGELIWEKPASFTNLLPLATDTDRKTIYNGKGYRSGYRLSSSNGGVTAAGGMYTSGFIPAQVGDVVRIKNIKPKLGTASYVMTFDSSNTKVGVGTLGQKGETDPDWRDAYGCIDSYNNGIITVTLDSATFGTGFDSFRFSAGVIDENTIVTINQEIPA